MQFQIEKLVYGGDGMTRLPADEHGHGKAVFVPFVLPGEMVEASLTETRPGFVRADLGAVLTPSPQRVEPQCSYFGGCGGCHYQHIRYEEQLRQKADILAETLRRTAKLELAAQVQLHASPPWNYRNRTRMRVRHKPEFALGYYRHNSHDILSVEACPISSQLINHTIGAVWQLGRDGNAPESLHGLQFFANHDETQLLLEGYVHRGSDALECQPFAAALHVVVPQLAGMVVFATSSSEDESSQRAPLTSPRLEASQTIGSESLVYQVAGHAYQVSGGSFFQINRYMIERLIEIVIAGRRGRAALDLYAGVGLLSQPLARNFDQVLAVEPSPHAIADLRHNVPHNVKCIRAISEVFLTQYAAKLAPDLVVVDPPRAGLGEKTAAALGRMSVSHVTYVSCDPATLSRDLRVLLQFGFRVEQAHLLDMFPQTYHMETVFHLVR